MQIRVGNRQDEPLIRAIIFQALEDVGIKSDLDSRDADLRNIEQNYFWHDGIFLVAERDGQIIGAAGARRRDSDELLELSRLAVTPGARKKGVAGAFLKTITFFAQGMEYKKIVITPLVPSSDLLLQDAKVWEGFGFQKDGDCWVLAVPAPVYPAYR